MALNDMKLEWKEIKDENKNDMWEADALDDYTGDKPPKFRIRQGLFKNETIWYDASDEVIRNRIKNGAGAQWDTLEDAKLDMDKVACEMLLKCEESGGKEHGDN